MAIILSGENEKRRVEAIEKARQDIIEAEEQLKSITAAAKEKYEEDLLNTTYLDFWANICESYEQERKIIDGTHMVIGSTVWSVSQLSTVINQCADMSGPIFRIGRIPPLRLPELYPSAPPSEYCSYTIVPGSGAPLSAENTIDTWKDGILYYLNGGFTGTGTTTTQSAITSSSTSFTVNTLSGIAAGNKLAIHGGGQSCLVTVTSVVGSTPPYTIQFNFQSTPNGIVFSPTGTIPSGATVTKNWPAFTNAERTTKTSANYQTVLNKAIQAWENYISELKNFLTNQYTIVTSNQDFNELNETNSPYANELKGHIDYYTSYLASSNVSDAGLNYIISNHINTRISQRNARIAALQSLLGRVYEKRYVYTLLRVDQAKGTLVLYRSYNNGIDIAKGNLELAKKALVAYET